MQITTLLDTPSLSVMDFQCSAQPHDPLFTEVHRQCSGSYVRRGSFGYQYRGESFELVSGALLIGREGDEFMCTHHHHHCGDECLSIHLAPELVDELGGGDAWRVGCVPPSPQLMLLGELAQASVAGASNIGIDEAALLLAARFVAMAAGQERRACKVSMRDRRRAVEAALLIDERHREPLNLDLIAASVGLSSYHFLRLFKCVIGVTPHQCLIRARLRSAARLLADAAMPITDVAAEVGFEDLSNFVRTFSRAAGASPGAFRKAARGDRKIFQERLARAV